MILFFNVIGSTPHFNEVAEYNVLSIAQFDGSYRKYNYREKKNFEIVFRKYSLV